MTCRCLGFCWVPEIFDHKYPRPRHHPNCEEYKTETFTVVEFDGVRCVMQPNEAKQMIEESEDEYVVSSVELTRDQFDNMEEFEGF